MTAGAHKYKLIALTKNRLNPAYTGARLGAALVAARVGCEVVYRVPDKPDDFDERPRAAAGCTSGASGRRLSRV